MTQWLIRLLRRVLAWLDPPVHDALYQRTRELVAYAETFAEGTSGEYKRHAVLAGLMKAFPGMPKRRLGLAIEEVLRDE